MKRDLLGAPHMVDLVAYANRIRAERGADRVPDLDPTEGGIRAEVLLLLEAPGPKAAPNRGGSGFVSADNPSPTSATLRHLLAEAGIDRTRMATWNVVPWYLGDDRRIRAARTADLRAGRPYVTELLGLLPALRVVVLVGRSARLAWQLQETDVPALACPHPSPQNLAARPDARALILAALREARAVMDGGPGALPGHGG